MIKSKIGLLIFSLFLLSSCTGFNPANDVSESKAKERMHRLVPEQATLKMEKEKGLVLTGTGGGKKLFLSFNCNGPIEIPVARDLIVYAVKRATQAINDNIKIRSELEKFPISSSDLELFLFVNKSNPSSVASVVFRFGKIQYFSENQDLLLEEIYSIVSNGEFR